MNLKQAGTEPGSSAAAWMEGEESLEWKWSDTGGGSKDASGDVRENPFTCRSTFLF